MLAVFSALIVRVRRSQSGRLVAVGVVCLVVGALLFAVTEHVSFGIGLYWSVTTATTVGYGDVTPKNTSGRIVAVAVMLTTIPLFASAFASFAGAVASTHLRRLLNMAHVDETENAVMVVGTSPIVPRLATALVRSGERVVVVGGSADTPLPAEVRVVVGDPTAEETLRKARPERAARLLVAGINDAEVLVTAVLLRQLAPKVATLAVAATPSVGAALGELGIAATVSADELLVHTLTKSLEAPHAGQLLLRLVNSDDLDLVEQPVASAELGRSLAAVRGERAGLVLGVVSGGQVSLGLSDDPVLAEGDRLIILERRDARR